MLSEADAALAARDPAITGLTVLLDPAAFAGALRAALPDAAIRAAEPTYARYKPRTSCLVAYKVVAAAGAVPVYARAYAPALRPKLRHARRLQGRPGALGAGGLTLDGLDIAVYCWPHDHALPALAPLSDPGGRVQLLAEVCPGRPDLGAATLVGLRHRPERRYVGRLAGAAGGDALVRLYGEDDYAAACAAAAAFRSAGPLRVAEPLGRSDRHRALLLPWVAGRSLAALLWGEAGDPEALRLTGAALALLHGQPARALPRGAPAIEDDLVAAARAVAAICPGLAPRALQLAIALAAELGVGPQGARPLHGDFYADQVLIGEGHATLLDLDNVRWGEPAADLGTFIAHLRRAAALGAGDDAQAARLTEALYAGYAAVSRPPAPHRVMLHTAVGLLRLAPEPFRYRAPDWPVRVEALVAAAEGALAACAPAARPGGPSLRRTA